MDDPAQRRPRCHGGCCSPERRVAGTKLAEYLALAPLLAARGRERIDEVIACKGPLWDRLIEPFLLGALNTDPRAGSAALAGEVLRQSLARGGKAYRVRIAHPTLAAAFVDPALAYLTAHGAEVRFTRQPVRSLSFSGDRVMAIETQDDTIPLTAEDTVVMATPPWVAPTLVPGMSAPDAFSPIVNAHFKTTPPPGASLMLGVIGGAAEWIFAFPDRLSVTVSGADHLGRPATATALAQAFWADIARVLRPAARRRRPTASSRNAAPPSQPPRSRTRNAPEPPRAGATSSWPATGPTPSSRRLSKARCDRQTRRPN